MEQSTRLFSRSMGRWLMTLLLVMVTSLAARAAEAYACYTPSNTTLTFYYDNSRSSRPGTTYSLPSTSINPDWNRDSNTHNSVTKVVFNQSFAAHRPSSTSYWFLFMENLQSISGLGYLNTSDVTSMVSMFGGCHALTSLDLSGFNTANVTNMNSMFFDCPALTSLNVSGFNTSNVIDMNYMFYKCSGLTSLNLSNFNTAKVTNMNSMFLECSALTSLNVSSFNTAKVTDMSHLFSGCSALTSLNVSNFNTANVTDMTSMFGQCESLTSLDVSNFNTAKVSNMNCMFMYLRSLTRLDLSSFNTSNVTEMAEMFLFCPMLRTIYVSDSWTTAAVTSSSDMFYSCNRLTGQMGTTFNANHVDKSYAHIDGGLSNPGYLTDINAPTEPEAYACYTPSNTTLTFYYDNSRSSRPGTTYDLNTSTTLPGWKNGAESQVTQVKFDSSFANARPSTTFLWFSDMSSLQSIQGMEYLNTSEVKNMSYMFGGCSSLTSLDLSHFNTAKVSTMEAMFSDCIELRAINVSGFNTSSVTDMTVMFYDCPKLTSLDLSSFNTSRVTKMQGMFYGNSNLHTIYVGSNWSTEGVTDSSAMFADCTSLVGGRGTTYDANNVDKAYAHIDGGPSNPGYLTDINGPEAYACYTPSNTTLTFYYDNSRSSRTGTTYDLNTGDNVPGWSDLHEDIHHVIFDPSFANARPTSTYFWFYNFEDPEFIGLNYLNTSEVTNMSGMFGFLHYLESIDVSHFDTSKVTDMSEMFEYTTLTSLDLSSFNTSNVTDMSLMFCESQSLQTIYVGEGWTTAAVTSSAEMFSNCTSLVGGHGTSYDANHVDKAYAHLDGGTSNPGYFTDINAPAEPEAYACYTPSNTTLTFYYDTQRSIRMGTTYDLNTGYNTPGWYNDGTRANVTKVVFDSSFADTRPISTYRWFNGMSNLTSITNITKLNTYYVTNMGYMFAGCSSLTSLNLSNFSTSNVVGMNYMFYGCEKLQSLNLGYNFAATNVTEMTGMFQNCKSLRSLDLNRFSTSQVTSMSKMFNNCVNLTTITVGRNWSAAAVTNSSDMFLGCTSLVGGMGTTYNSSHIDKAYAHVDGGSSNPGYLTGNHEAYACYTPSNTTLSFYYDGQWSNRPGSVYYVNMVTGYANPSWYGAGIASSVTHVVIDPSMAGTLFPSTYRWFANMSKLVSITGLNYLKTSMTTNMGSMFQDCSRLTSLDLSNFITTSVEDMRYMFAGCSNLVTVYVGNGWSTAATTTSNSVDMFQGCTKIRGEKGTTYSSSHTNKLYARIDGGTSNPGYFTTGNEAYACYTPSNTTLTFYYDKQRSSRTGTTYRLNTGTSNPGWYSVRASVTKVVFTPSFAEALPTSTYYWFYEMTNLTSISGLNYLNTSAVTNMAYMFYRCSQLTSLDLSGFNTAKVISMSNMFNGCNRLTSLDLSSFNTANVTHMTNMFYSCSKLTSLDLSSFNTANVTNMASMFRSCTGLVTIYAGSEWSTAAATLSGNMFTGCSKLVGGMGTTYDANHVDAAYAHIDGGPSNPGYFSALFIRGDVDNNGEIKIADVTALINYLLSGDASAINLQAADCDQNGEIKIGDVTALINYLLSGSW